MTTAREIIARANYEHWSNIPSCTDSKPWDVLAVKLPGQHADFLRKADAQLAALTAAGFRIVGPGEVDKVTEAMVEAAQRIRDVAMRQTIAARLPECGEFGGIAQDADWLVDALTAAQEAGK